LQYEPGLGALSALSAAAYGVFRGESAVAAGLTRKQLAALRSAGVIERVLPDTYRMTAVQRSNRQALKAALLWAGRSAAAAGLSAGELYELQGVRAHRPEIVVPSKSGLRSPKVAVHRSDHRAALMIRALHGFRVTGIEPTLVAAASSLSDEQLELACEDARRRRLTSMPALQAYLARHGRSGRPGVADLRTFSTSPSCDGARFSRPTDDGGTTTRPTTKTTTRSGVCPPGTGSASSSPRG
jgi:hypothetical protein